MSGTQAPFAIELYFDAASEAAVVTSWKALARSGVSESMLKEGFRPHISLGLSDELDVDGLADDLEKSIRLWKPLTITLSSIGIFATQEGVIFYGVTVTSELLDVHREFWQVFPRHAEGVWDYYRPGNWVPHCTLAFWLKTEEMGAALKVARETPLPIQCRIQEMAIAEVSSERCRTLRLWHLGAELSDS